MKDRMYFAIQMIIYSIEFVIYIGVIIRNMYERYYSKSGEVRTR